MDSPLPFTLCYIESDADENDDPDSFTHKLDAATLKDAHQLADNLRASGFVPIYIDHYPDISSWVDGDGIRHWESGDPIRAEDFDG